MTIDSLAVRVHPEFPPAWANIRVVVTEDLPRVGLLTRYHIHHGLLVSYVVHQVIVPVHRQAGDSCFWPGDYMGWQRNLLPVGVPGKMNVTKVFNLFGIYSTRLP